jgi:hypothetical protein
VLVEDSLSLIRGKRIALITNQTGVDAAGVSDIDVLNGAAARAAGVTLVKLFSPEHGIRGTEDRENLESGIDQRSGLAVHSLYTVTAIAPPDSLLRNIDALVFDLQDIGTRTWTYVGSMIYAMRAAARRHLPIIVLDRPNPITGDHVDGPMLDTGLANANEHTAERSAKPYALYPFPLRHGMTMGELALFYNSVLGINAPLRVVPVSGWRRSMWFDETGLPWVRPSPNLPTLTSALLYPSLVAFEVPTCRSGGTTLSRIRRAVARREACCQFTQRDASGGVRFVVDSFTPQSPGDQKYGGKRIPAFVDVTDRNAVQTGALTPRSVGGARASRLSRIDARSFDERFGSTRGRRPRPGDNPRTVMEGVRGAVASFSRCAALSDLSMSANPRRGAS